MRHFLSLGAGVQSTTVALMAAKGLISPMPEAAIFADTGAEPGAVYDHLADLVKFLPFPVHIVRKADGLTDNIEKSVKAGRFAGAPFFADTGSKAAGMLRRQCTGEFKLGPITRKTRELVGLSPRQQGPKTPIVTQWIGISLDEVVRATPSRTRWIENRWPLLEARMSRNDCMRWLAGNGFPIVARSACVYCPYKTNAEWRRLRDDDPEGWAEALRVDALIRTGVRGVRDPLFVHRSLKPLDEVDLSTPEDRGQLNMFSNECLGMCGV